jgi:nicotinamide mononucleotide transporter
MPEREKTMNILFTAWGYDVTIIELLASVLALIGVALGVLGSRWVWPLYFLSGALYAWLFVEFDLLASGALQLIFMAAAIWGWFGWGPEGASPRQLSSARRGQIGAIALLSWIALAPALKAIGGAATWLDAFVLIGSLVAQVLMVLEFTESWAMWIVVNVVGTIHYARQELYFTALLYFILLIVAVMGWRTWRRTLQLV